MKHTASHGIPTGAEICTPRISPPTSLCMHVQYALHASSRRRQLPNAPASIWENLAGIGHGHNMDGRACSIAHYCGTWASLLCPPLRYSRERIDCGLSKTRMLEPHRDLYSNTTQSKQSAQHAYRGCFCATAGLHSNATATSSFPGSRPFLYASSPSQTPTWLDRPC